MSGQFLTPDTNGDLIWANPAEGDQLFNSNVLLNAYRTAENIELPALKMIDGAVDAFTDENAVNIATSSNEFFDSGNDFYAPTGVVGLTVPMVNFNGTNAYLSVSGSTLGQSDGKKFTISFWIKPLVDGEFARLIDATTSSSNGSKFLVSRDFGVNPGRIQVFFRNPSNTPIADVSSRNAVKVADGLTHVLIAVDMIQNLIQIRIDGGAVETNIVSTAVANDIIDFSVSEVSIGASTPTAQAINGVAQDFTGEMGQVYLTEEYIDISIPANLAKFYDNGNPVDLGSDGSTPTGNQPLIFLNIPYPPGKQTLVLGVVSPKMGP